MLDITTKVYNDHQPRHRIDIIMNNYRKSLMLRVWAAPGASETIPEDPIKTITHKTSHTNYHQKDVPEKLSPKRRPIKTITKKTPPGNYLEWSLGHTGPSSPPKIYDCVIGVHDYINTKSGLYQCMHFFTRPPEQWHGEPRIA
jgi:hypothetical protein